MNIGKVLNYIAQNNISPEEVFQLVEKIKSLDLKDEKNLREIIHEASKIAGKKIDKQKEDFIVKKILSDEVSEDLFEML